MKNITVCKRKIDKEALYKRKARRTDASITIDEPCRVYDEAGNYLFYYADFEKLNITDRVLKKIKYGKARRSSGIMSSSKIFGYQPRSGLRVAPCSIAKMTKEFPVENQIVTDLCERVEAIYKKEFPEIHKSHIGQVNEEVLQDWRINGGVFTSGIINFNNPLNYHLDNNNYKNYRSCMLNFRHNCLGGYLVIPEYDIKFLLKDNTVIIFDGATVVHGVSDLTLLDKTSYRYSIVFYSLYTMKPCRRPDEELKRFQKRQTELVHERWKK